MSSLAVRMAVREVRASAGKFAFVVIAVSIGIGVLTGVRGFSEAFRNLLFREARTLMAGDLSVRTFAPPNTAQRAALDSLASRGVGETQVIETVSMLSREGNPMPLFVSVKAVDPAKYPFYGKLVLDPEGDLRERLTPDAAIVSDDTLIRFGVKTGDLVKLGAAQFRIAGVIRTEPDRMTGSLNVGPRIMISRAGLERTGLITFGSRASFRMLFRLDPAGVPVAQVRAELDAVYKGFSRVADFRETHPLITQGLDRSTTFLSLIGLIALIVAGLGAGTAMQSHLEQRLDSIAILKCLGARSGQVIRIYLLQAAVLGLAGSIGGVLAGLAVQAAFPAFIGRYFTIAIPTAFAPRSAVEGLITGLLVTVLFTLPALLRIREVKPALIFRRDMSERKDAWRGRRAELASGLLIGAVLFGLACWLGESLKVGLWFLGALLASWLILAGAAKALLQGLRRLPRLWPGGLPVALRHGIANLYRPGTHAATVLVSLGLGVTFTLSVYLLQNSLLKEILSSAPKDMPNVFVINITDKERDGVAAILKSQPGIESAQPPVAAWQARLVTIDNRSVDAMKLEGFARRFQGPRPITETGEKPKNLDVVRGEWWKAKPAARSVSVEQEAARALGIDAGSEIVWELGGKTLPSRVAAIHRGHISNFGSGVDFYFNEGALEGIPANHFASARVQPKAVPALQKAIFDRYPTITIINGADVLAIVQDVIDRIALVVRFISGFTILTGSVVLAAGIAATRFRRVREVVILKTLGATRNRLARIFSVEFLILGAAAGIFGSLLATAFSSLVLSRLLDARFRLEWAPNLTAIALTAFLANGVSWLSGWRIVRQKPLDVLREV